MVFVVWALIVLSVVANITFVARHKRCALGHKYSDWTPWHGMALRHKFGYDVKEVSFRRNRYCVRCAKEDIYTIGRHNCEDEHCTHMDTYIVALDEKAQIRALEKELGM